MKYFLKIWGSTKTDQNEDIFTTYKQNETAFWREHAKIWFSESNFGGNVDIGDILIQYIPLGQPQRQLAGRVVGYYLVESNFEYGNLNSKWFRYVRAKNLNAGFSEKSKHKTVLAIKDVMKKMPSAIQCGCAIISDEQAKTIINRIDTLA